MQFPTNGTKCVPGGEFKKYQESVELVLRSRAEDFRASGLEISEHLQRYKFYIQNRLQPILMPASGH